MINCNQLVILFFNNTLLVSFKISHHNPQAMLEGLFHLNYYAAVLHLDFTFIVLLKTYFAKDDYGNTESQPIVRVSMADIVQCLL